MNAALAAEIARLSPAEKLLLVEELWNQIARASNTMGPPAKIDRFPYAIFGLAARLKRQRGSHGKPL